MQKNLLFIITFINTLSASAECLDQANLSKLKAEQLAYFQAKFPPAFKHAFEDDKVTLEYQTTDTAQTDACRVDLRVTLPQEDLTLSHTILDKDPAKKIMLNAQGYGLPETNSIQATFSVEKHYQSLPSQAYLQTQPLGKLTSQLELMYAFVTQAKAEAISAAAQPKPWQKQEIKQAETKCQSLASSASTNCACRVEKLSQQIAFRDYEYIDSIQNNPYAFATTAGASIKAILSPVDQACAKLN